MKSLMRLALLPLFLFLLAPAAASAESFGFDQSFGAGGIANAGRESFGDDLALQADGKVVAVGETPDEGPGGVADRSAQDFVVARFDSLGKLDPSFGSGGTATYSFGDRESGANAVAVQPDGKIIVGGYARRGSSDDSNPGPWIILRLLANGQLDTSFSDDGSVSYATEGFDLLGEVYDVASAPDGGVYVTGAGSADDGTHVIHLDAAGNFDPAYGGGDGVAVVTATGDTGNYFGTDLVVAPDGGAFVIGQFARSTGSISSDNIGLVGRLDATGSPVAGFGSAGVAEVAKPNEVGAGTVAADGKIYLAGRDDTGFDAVQLTRLNADGSLDSGFGSGGTATTTYREPGGFDDANLGATGVVVRPDGRALVSAAVNGFDAGLLAQYTAAGAPDGSFGRNGVAVSDLIADAQSVVLDGAGKPYTTSLLNTGNDSPLAVARFLANAPAPAGGGGGGGGGGTGGVDDADVTAKKKQKQKGKKIKVKVSAGAQEAVTAKATGKVKIGKKKIKLKPQTKQVDPGERVILKLKPKGKKNAKKISKALKKGKKVKAPIKVVLTDAEGMTAIEKRVVRLK